MNDHLTAEDMLNVRRFFRNRFELFAASLAITPPPDGSSLTLADVCLLLKNDAEPFQHQYRRDLRLLLGSGFLARGWPSYGNVARALVAARGNNELKHLLMLEDAISEQPERATSLRQSADAAEQHLTHAFSEDDTQRRAGQDQ